MRHPFAPLVPGGRPLGELIDRHADLAARGLANCRAAQALKKEINRRRLEAQSAFLANDDNHYDPLEHRDDDGKWTTGPNAASSSNKNASLPAKITGTPLKFGFGLNEGLQNVASAIGEGFAQLMDPGPLPHDFHTFLRAQNQALATPFSPSLDPLTGELTGPDNFARAMWQMNQEREIARERLRAPGEAFSEAAAEEAAEFGQLKDAAPGPKIAGTLGVKTGETLGYIAPAAIPFVGPVTGPIAAGLASTGDTFNEAYEQYRQAGYSDDEAREQARKVALNTGVATAIIFAAPVGQLATLPKSALTRLLLTMGIDGAQLSADQLQSLLQAKASYNPNLTLADIAKQTGNSFLMGAVLSGLSHGFEGVSRHNSPLPFSAAERQAFEQNIQARRPISSDTLARANVSGGANIPKGYEPDIPNDRLVYTGTDVAGAPKSGETQSGEASASNGPNQQKAGPADSAKATEPPIALKPYGGPGGGHHPVAKSALEGDPNNDPNKQLAIPNSELARLNVQHPVISGKQQILYRAFAKTNQKLTWDAVEKIETEALVLSGVKSESIANDAVKRAINALKADGVEPKRIPWGD